jgi:Bifunctional DNA primase/polymerase, N-terminal
MTNLRNLYEEKCNPALFNLHATQAPEPNQTEPLTTLGYALFAAELGIRVFPANPKTKISLLKKWPEIATTDIDVIRRWFGQIYPNAMIGAATGAKSGFWVLDIDVKDGVDAFTKLEALETKYGKLNPFLTIKTPSSGLHLYFKQPNNTLVKTNAGVLGVGIDIRGDGGCIMFAGSTRYDGERYEIIGMGA